MAVDPKIQAYLDRLNSKKQLLLSEINAEQFRNSASMEGIPADEKEEVYNIEDDSLPLEGRDLHIRIYTPEGEGPLPLLMFYHGGGWVTGNLDSHDSICRSIANIAGCKVISVDYRLAPEHPFPAAVDDAYDSLVWIAENAQKYNVDPQRIAVGGDSAGGNLAAVACLKAKETKGPPIIFQLLLYPSTGYEEEPPSIRENGEGYLLTKELMEWFRDQYFRSREDMQSPYASPVLAEDLSGLPPALIATAQYDPLRDVGRTYAEKLEESGVPVTYKNYETLIHGFANFHAFVPSAQNALRECAEMLRDVFLKK